MIESCKIWMVTFVLFMFESEITCTCKGNFLVIHAAPFRFNLMSVLKCIFIYSWSFWNLEDILGYWSPCMAFSCCFHRFVIILSSCWPENSHSVFLDMQFLVANIYAIMTLGNHIEMTLNCRGLNAFHIDRSRIIVQNKDQNFDMLWQDLYRVGDAGWEWGD